MLAGITSLASVPVPLLGGIFGEVPNATIDAPTPLVLAAAVVVAVLGTWLVMPRAIARLSPAAVKGTLLTLAVVHLIILGTVFTLLWLIPPFPLFILNAVAAVAATVTALREGEPTTADPSPSHAIVSGLIAASLSGINAAIAILFGWLALWSTGTGDPLHWIPTWTGRALGLFVLAAAVMLFVPRFGRSWQAVPQGGLLLGNAILFAMVLWVGGATILRADPVGLLMCAGPVAAIAAAAPTIVSLRKPARKSRLHRRL